MSKNEKNKSARRMADKKWFIVLLLRSELLRRVAMAAVIVCFAFAGSARAAWLEKQKLLADDGAARDCFGVSSFICGDYAIAGAYWDDDNGSDSGSAYIFKREGAVWNLKQKLLPLDGAAGDCFGFSVSMSGDYIIVGANDIWGEKEFGSVYIFKREETEWIEKQKLAAPSAHDDFGRSVSISGDYVIVGAYGDDDKGTDAGAAYIFKRDGENWVQPQKLFAPNGVAWDYFGFSVSISGDYAIVGADETYSGSAYIFKRDGISWAHQQTLIASDGEYGDNFGISVSITSATAGAGSGDYAIVGVMYDDDKGSDSGSAHIFKRNGESWSWQQKLTAWDGAAQDYFGVAVSICDDLAIIGAIGDDDKGNYSGSAYIFERDGTKWLQQPKLLASDGAAEDYFGYQSSVSISGNWAIVGAIQLYSGGNGKAFIFEKCPTADLSGDCCVNFIDLAFIVEQWLQAPGVPSADIAPEGGDGVVNLLDLAVLCAQWHPCDK